MADPTRCPDCGATLQAQECPSCGLVLRGPLAAELWRVVTSQEALERRRADLLARLRSGESVAPPAPASPAPSAWAPSPGAWQARPPKPRKEWTPERVQNVILVTGVLVTLVAAVIFTAFQWGGLPLWARGALMLGVTGVTGWGARFVHDRGLASSAESIAALAVLFGVVDAYAVRAAGLVGDVGAAPYWTVATAVLAGGAAAFARYVPVRSVRLASLALAQLPVVITVVNTPDARAEWRAVLLAAQAAALVAVATRLGGTADAARASAVANWGVALVSGLVVAYDTDPRAGALALLVVGVAPLVVPLLHREWDPFVPAVLSTLTLVLAAVAPAYDRLPGEQLPAVIAAVGLIAVVAGAGLPERWRTGPSVVGGGTVGVAVLAVGLDVVVAVLAPFAWASDVWSVSGDPAARAAIAPEQVWEGTVVTLGVVATAAVAAAVGSLVERRVLPYAFGLTAVAVVLVPLGFAWSFRAALAWDVAAGAAAVGAAAITRRPYVALLGCVALAVAAGWSLADEGATLAVLAAVAVTFGVVAIFVARQEAAAVSATAAASFALVMALSRGTPVDRAGFVLATTACTLLAAAVVARVASVAVVAGVAYATALALAATGPGWLAWTLALGAAVTGVRALKDARLAPAPAALATACAGVTALAWGWPADRTAFVVTLAAAACVAAGYGLRDERLEMVAVVAYAVAVAMALPDPGWLSWVLAAGGVTTLANAIRPERRSLAWAGGALLTGCSWVRLYLEDVRMPEAYAAPLAATALAFGHLRRRANPGQVGSWSAYGTGLSLAFGPTTWLVLSGDAGLTRPVLLAAAGVAVLLAGVNERLQAPLTVGAAALGIDALVQLGPVAAALPKWASLGAAGLVAIAVGVTYEDRRRDVERLRRTYDSLS